MRKNCAKKELSGKLDGLRSQISELTARSSICDDALAQSKEFLQNTLDALSSHIAILDESGTILAVNEAWRSFGRGNDAQLSGDGIGTNYLQICDSAEGAWSEDAPAVARMIRELITGDREEFNKEYPCHSPYEKRWFLLHATRFRMRDKISVVLAHQTITERKLAEEALQESAEELAATNQELLRSNQDLELFAYVASHDLQEPLRSITNALQMLVRKQEGRLGEDSDQLIRFAVEGAKKMRGLIEGLLSYARVRTGPTVVEMVDLNRVLNESILNLKALIERKQARITYGKMPTVPGDFSQLLQVFQNLIDNAIKFAAMESPHVEIRAKNETNEWVFSVHDSGIGIQTDQFGRIFEIFQQLSREDYFEGTGIGLAIVKKIVERHGGRVWVESEVGVGSSFYFTVPK
jgi:signal transduction histidine kinase